MHKDPTDDSEESGSRSGSRRSSGPFARRDSIKKEVEKKIQPASASSTPKKVAKTHNLDFLVTGKQLLKRSDRANSLPGSYHRRQSADYLLKSKRSLDSPRRIKSREKTRDTSLESNMSLDLSQMSDIENPTRNLKDKIPFATSTPKKVYQKANTLPSIQQLGRSKEENLESKENLMSCSRDSVKNSSSTGTYRQGVSTEFDYSSMSPECSGPSSGDSIAGIAQDTLISPRSQDLQDSSVCISRCDSREMGEWGHFWANYNNSLARVPISRYYDQCPTPYRSEDIDLTELEFPPETSKIRSPENIKSINNIIRNEGLRLTPRETQNIIKCAHMLGNVLTKAIERQSKEYKTEKIQELQEKANPEKELKKKAMTLNLRETALPIEVKEETRWESVPTQTDISLPNTKSAPIIFENILRQLSMSSLEVPGETEREQNKVDANNGDGN
ncbi:uncharacterized protein LOC123666122 [Melitaea cinxia]|uniref:uncharacterized protein LOC123666122 n=1 Tax=Melitaea cinxia TaxID=113334 RepID=UPI001E27032F|nr:uncharacterized protein LOC123666122 [Melitaea cinxia]